MNRPGLLYVYSNEYDGRSVLYSPRKSVFIIFTARFFASSDGPGKRNFIRGGVKGLRGGGDVQSELIRVFDVPPRKMVMAALWIDGRGIQVKDVGWGRGC